MLNPKYLRHTAELPCAACKAQNDALLMAFPSSTPRTIKKLQDAREYQVSLGVDDERLSVIADITRMIATLKRLDPSNDDTPYHETAQEILAKYSQVFA